MDRKGEALIEARAGIARRSLCHGGRSKETAAPAPQRRRGRAAGVVLTSCLRTVSGPDRGRQVTAGDLPTKAGFEHSYPNQTVGALTPGEILSKLICGVRTADPMTFAVVSVLLAAVALCATVIPAWRATKVDPVQALREE